MGERDEVQSQTVAPNNLYGYVKIKLYPIYGMEGWTYGRVDDFSAI